MARLGVHGDGDLHLIEPLGYLPMLGLVDGARLVVTDSGGLQEETTYLGVPCLTVRPNTERPITCEQGTNRLVAADRDTLLRTVLDSLEQPRGKRPIIDRWDGKTAQRIVAVLLRQSSRPLNTPPETLPAPRSLSPVLQTG
jgi:UDP-N-acetylglucosamine 2-epimerase (non-hydrolysing)